MPFAFSLSHITCASGCNCSILFWPRSEKSTGDLFISKRVTDDEERSHNDEAGNKPFIFMTVYVWRGAPRRQRPLLTSVAEGFGIVTL